MRRRGEKKVPNVNETLQYELREQIRRNHERRWQLYTCRIVID